MASYHFTSPLSNGSPLSYKFLSFNCPLALKAGHLLRGREREGRGRERMVMVEGEGSRLKTTEVKFYNFKIEE